MDNIKNTMQISKDNAFKENILSKLNMLIEKVDSLEQELKSSKKGKTKPTNNEE